MRFLHTGLALFVLVAPATTVSQEIQTFEVARAPSSERVPGPEVLNTDAPALPATGGQEAAAEHGTVYHVLRALGGAAVGAWAGYLASQVAVGSWDDQSAISRESWAAGGAAVGITLGLTVPVGRVGPRRPWLASQEPGRRADRNTLTREDIQSSNAGDLYSIIRSLRPEWLRTRGTGSMRETPRGEADGVGFDITVTPGIATIKVYLDETYMGDVAALHQIDPALVGRVRFLDAAEATLRLGKGHIHGAIMVTIAPVP